METALNNADADDDAMASLTATMTSRWIQTSLYTDGDGTGDNADIDDDGDGVPDEDAFPKTPQSRWTLMVTALDNADHDDDGDGK